MNTESENKKPESGAEIPEPEIKKPESGNSTHDISVADNISNTLLGEMPEVQQHAIDNEAAQQEEIKAKYADLKDRHGNSFDPAIHKTGKDGEPTLSPQGNLIKKPGRKKADANNNSGGSVIGGLGQEDKKVDPEAQQRATARVSGTMAANLMITLGVVVGGEEWHPVKHEKTGLDEKLMLEGAFADYFEATGKTDIPPGMALTVAIGGYVLPRFTMPKTRGRLQKVKDWIVGKIAARKLKKHNLKVVKADSDKDGI